MSDRASLITELFSTIDVAKRSMHGHMQTVIEGHTISRSEFELLITLRHCQPTTAKQLTRKLNLTPGAISQLVDELTAQTLIESETDPNDRRRHVLHTSANGDRLIKQLDQRRHDILNQVIKDLTDEELETWLKIQHRIIDVFQIIQQAKQT